MLIAHCSLCFEFKWIKLVFFINSIQCMRNTRINVMLFGILSLLTKYHKLTMQTKLWWKNILLNYYDWSFVCCIEITVWCDICHNITWNYRLNAGSANPHKFANCEFRELNEAFVSIYPWGISDWVNHSKRWIDSTRSSFRICIVCMTVAD